MDPYLKTLLALLELHEFRALLSLFRGSLFVVIGFLAVLMLFHMLYYLGQSSPLYRLKPPPKNWSRRFFPAIFVLVGALLLVIWGIGKLLDPNLLYCC